MLAMQSDDEDEVESRTFVENGILVELKNADSIDTKSTQHHSASKHPQYKSLKTFQAHNMTEYLFFNDNGQPELSEESIAQAYQSYTTLLGNAYRQMGENYNKLAEAAYVHGEAIKQGIEPPLPLSAEPIQTNSLQSYLDEDLI